VVGSFKCSGIKVKVIVFAGHLSPAAAKQDTHLILCYSHPSSAIVIPDPLDKIILYMDDSPILSVLFKLAAVFLLVLANAFFVGAEFALVSIRRSRIASLIEAGNKRGDLLFRITEDLTGYISACQVGVTLASLALGGSERTR
jgi:hypothetical protein